jgi:hypothetical protein
LWCARLKRSPSTIAALIRNTSCRSPPSHQLSAVHVPAPALLPLPLPHISKRSAHSILPNLQPRYRGTHTTAASWHNSTAAAAAALAASCLLLRTAVLLILHCSCNLPASDRCICTA